MSSDPGAQLSFQEMHASLDAPKPIQATTTATGEDLKSITLGDLYGIETEPPKPIMTIANIYTGPDLIDSSEDAEPGASTSKAGMVENLMNSSDSSESSTAGTKDVDNKRKSEDQEVKEVAESMGKLKTSDQVETPEKSPSTSSEAPKDKTTPKDKGKCGLMASKWAM